MTIENIKSFAVDRGSMEDLVSLLAYGKLVQAEFESLELEQPEWLGSKLRQIRREVIQKNADVTERRLANAKLQLSSLKTPQERKLALQTEIRKLEKALTAEG